MTKHSVAYNLDRKGHKLNVLIKSLALLAFGNSYSVQRKLNAIDKAGVLTILNLHRVAEDDGSAYKPLNPSLFQEMLVFLGKNFEIITFADLDTKHLPKKPRLIISFDDGYKDFMDIAVPILEKHKIRVNQNIIPECIERQLPPLNVLAQDFIGKAPLELLRELIIPGIDIHKLTSNRVKMGLRVSAFLKNKPIADQMALQEELLPQFFDFDNFQPTKMMSTEDVRQLVGFHEFGAHSFSHASMAFESDEYFKQDLVNCRKYFEVALKTSVDIYAFPNGSYRDNHLEIAKAYGYKNVLLVDDLFSFCDSGIHHRFGFTAQSRREVVFRTIGGLTKVL